MHLYVSHNLCFHLEFLRKYHPPTLLPNFGYFWDFKTYFFNSWEWKWRVAVWKRRLTNSLVIPRCRKLWKILASDKQTAQPMVAVHWSRRGLLKYRFETVRNMSDLQILKSSVFYRIIKSRTELHRLVFKAYTYGFWKLFDL